MKAVTALFEEAQKRAKNNAYRAIFKILKQAVKAFSTEETDELLEEVMHEFPDSQHFTQMFVYNLIK